MARKKRVIGYGIVQCDCCKGKRYMRINYSGKSTKPKPKTIYKSFNNMTVEGNDHHCSLNSFNNESCAYRFKLNVYMPVGGLTEGQKNTLEKLCDTYDSYDNLFFDDETSGVQDSATYDKETNTYTCPVCKTVIPDPNVNGITECPTCGTKLVTTPNETPPQEDSSMVSLIARQDRDGNFICPECERIIENPVLNGVSVCGHCGTKSITKAEDVGTLVATYKEDENKFYCSICNVELTSAKIGTTMRCENCGALMLISYMETGKDVESDIPSANYIESINGFECPNCNELITSPVVGGITVCGVCNTNSITVLPDDADTSRLINDVPHAIYNPKNNTYTCPNNTCNHVFTDLSITGYTKCPECGLYSISNVDYEIITYPNALYDAETGEYICFSCGEVLENVFLGGETTCPNCGSINTTAKHDEDEPEESDDTDIESDYPDAIYDSMNDIYYCSNDKCNMMLINPIINTDNVCGNCTKYSFVRKFRPGISKDYPYALYNNNDKRPSNNICPNCKKLMTDAIEGTLAKCSNCNKWSYVTSHANEDARTAIYDSMRKLYYCFNCGAVIMNPILNKDNKCSNCDTLVYVNSDHTTQKYLNAEFNENMTNPMNNKCPHCGNVMSDYIINSLNRCSNCSGWSYVTEFDGTISNAAIYDTTTEMYYCYKCGMPFINPYMDSGNICGNCGTNNFVKSQE